MASSASVKPIHIWLAAILIFSLAAGPWVAGTRAAGAVLALHFDGVNDYVALGDTGDLMGGTSWISGKTLSLWVLVNSGAPPTGTPPSGEVVAGVDTPRLFGISRSIYNGQDRLWVWNSDNNGVDLVGVEFTPGVWMHIALVHDGANLSAYKNGVLVGSIASGPTQVPNFNNGDGKLFLGGSGRSSATTYFEGDLDEVSFWNTIVDGGTLGEWWDQEVTGDHPYYANLSAYYQMTDGAGTLLSDNSGHGRIGTLLGGMGDLNWVPSGALGGDPPGDTPTPTVTVTPTPTATFDPSTPTSTATAPPPTNTPTITPVLPTSTATATATVTNTALPPTNTPTATATSMATNTPTVTAQPFTPTATATQPPGSGYTLQFDGVNDFVELDETVLMLGPGWQNTKTISLWVRPLGTATACQNNSTAWCDAIFGDRPRWWGISRGVIGGLDRIWVFNTDGSSGSSVDIIGVTYTPGEWVHIAMVHANGMLQVYKNGMEVGVIPSGTTMQPNTGAHPVLHLGGIINNSSRNWSYEGQIDEVQMWSVPRSAADIQATLYSPLTGNESGLGAYYRMSDGAGTTLTDDSLNTWDGVLFDGARGVPPNGGPATWVTPGIF